MSNDMLTDPERPRFGEPSGPGFYFAPIVNLAERLVQLYFSTKQNVPRSEFDLDVTVMAGSMPLSVAERHYVLEVSRLFISCRTEGCRLVPEKALNHQEIVDSAGSDHPAAARQALKTSRRLRLGGRIRLPFVSGGAQLNQKTEGLQSGSKPERLLAIARHVAGGWEVSAVDTNGIFSRSKALAGRLLSGATELSEPIGTFCFDPGKTRANVFFEVRLPYGGLSIRYGDQPALNSDRQMAISAAESLGEELNQNIESLKSRVAGLLVEKKITQHLIDTKGRDSSTGEWILCEGGVEAVLLTEEDQRSESQNQSRLKRETKQTRPTKPKKQAKKRRGKV